MVKAFELAFIAGSPLESTKLSGPVGNLADSLFKSDLMSSSSSLFRTFSNM